jgi:AcrR family transcriptional regulator
LLYTPQVLYGHGMVSPVGMRRTQVERRQESENALLAAAAEVIAERGINGASLSVIGERAGTSRGLPTHHFGSKDALVARVASAAQDRMAGVLLASVERSRGAANTLLGLDLIRVSIDAYLELFEHPTANDRVLIVTWGATFPSESSIEGILDADRRAYEGWADLITRGQKDGSIRPDVDPTASAVILHGMLRGVAALLLTEAEYTDMTSVRGTVDQFIAGALASTSEDGPTARP